MSARPGSFPSALSEAGAGCITCAAAVVWRRLERVVPSWLCLKSPGNTVTCALAVRDGLDVRIGRPADTTGSRAGAGSVWGFILLLTCCFVMLAQSLTPTFCGGGMYHSSARELSFLFLGKFNVYCFISKPFRESAVPDIKNLAFDPYFCNCFMLYIRLSGFRR